MLGIRRESVPFFELFESDRRKGISKLSFSGSIEFSQIDGEMPLKTKHQNVLLEQLARSRQRPQRTPSESLGVCLRFLICDTRRDLTGARIQAACRNDPAHQGLQSDLNNGSSKFAKTISGVSCFGLFIEMPSEWRKKSRKHWETKRIRGLREVPVNVRCRSAEDR